MRETMWAYWLIPLLQLAPVFVGGSSSPDCPDNWKPYNASCYGIFKSSFSSPSKTWEDARTYCQSFGGDLVSIGSRKEGLFIVSQLASIRGRTAFWIGLYRNSSGVNPKVGWSWVDGTKVTYSIWGRLEPNNFRNNERCGVHYGHSRSWNDLSCELFRSYVCERPKGLIVPTLPARNITAGKPEIICDLGWTAFRKSCYKITSIKRSWRTAKIACADYGGHLLKIDDQVEQDYFFNQVKDRHHARYWIGLNDPFGNRRWQWESNRTAPQFTNWYTKEPNGRGSQRCVEMYGGRLAGYWNDNFCSVLSEFICEKEEGRTQCPDDWTLMGDNCYQFNLAESQRKNWTAAKLACESVGDFSSLVSIHNETEQSFLTKEISSVAKSAVWIGLNDREFENVFKWSDKSEVDYQNWLNNNPKTANWEWKDCAVLLGMRTDGAWAMERCREPRRYICQRKKGFFNCDAPLGMENGNINDDQITAKNSASPSNRPSMSRLRSNGTWCPKSKGDYLQIDLSSIYTIKHIALQGLATSYCIRSSNDGKSYKPYGTQASVCQELKSDASGKPHFLQGLRPFLARYIRITPTQGKNLCVQLELYGCLSGSSMNPAFKKTTWYRIPSTRIQYQINHLQLPWTEARSYCLEQQADLLSMSTRTIASYMERRLNTLSTYAFWIGLTDRDYPSMFYWTDGSPVNYVTWGSFFRSGSANCVQYRRYRSTWRIANCLERRPFVCMKTDPAPVDPSTRVKVGAIGKGVTGVWMSSATHYWPLSNVDDGKLAGIITGKAYGNIKVIPGVKDKPDSALQFSKSGMYIDVPLPEQDCLTFPDVCPLKHLTLSFMAAFDDAAVTKWDNMVILDSLGGSELNSTGISVFIKDKKLCFVVSYVNFFWKINVAIQGDNVWRHYGITCSPLAIAVFVNGKSSHSRAYRPTRRKVFYSTNLKKNFHIGLQPDSKVSPGVLGLTMFALWDRILKNDDILAIYKTEFGWCPNGWLAFGMSCYKFTTGRSTWSTARAQCQKFGGDLATVSTPVEQALITNRIASSSWIGLKENQVGFRRFFKTRLDFSWANSAPAVYTNWRSHRTFSFRSSLPSCGAVQATSGFWAQTPCTLHSSSICEKGKDETKPVVNATLVNLPKFVRVCQYSRAVLSCPSGSVIQIKAGFWGRKQRNVCRYVSIIDCGLDTVSSITDKLSDTCDGSPSCPVQASQNENNYGNPCLGVYKYLEVNYTCTLKENLKKQPCKPGWVRSNHNGVACYRLIQSKKTWSDAKKACQKYDGAKLVSIGDRSEQVFATSLMERAWNTDVWIGLSFSDETNTYSWSDRSSVTWSNWAVGNPRGAWTGDHCVYMNLERTTSDLMYWRVGNCSQEKLFICKQMLSSSNTPTKPTQPSPPRKEGTCPTAWTLFNGNCYRHFQTWKTWRDAKSHCRPSFFVSSSTNHLASITSKEENDFITKLANETIWIGLEGRGVYRGHAWVDETPVSYTNWDIGQPDSYNGREACTQLSAYDGYWGDINCYLRRSFVCKRGLTSTPIHPSASPTFVPSSRCKKGWMFFNNMCYYISDDRNSSNFKTWHTADTSCRLVGAHLVSVTSNEEKDFLAQFTRRKLTYSFWIGLHDVGGESLYKWTDGTGYGKYVYWANGEPNNFHGQEDCVAMLKTSGKWNDNHCSQKKSYICKSRTKDASPWVLTKAKKVAGDGYCPSGWVVNGKFCYEFHTDETDYKTWQDAKSTCEKGTNSSSVGELVSIGNEIEQAFITLHLKGAKVPLWIGLNNFHAYRSYFWADSSPSNFFHWNKGHPLFAWRKCVEISPFERDAGRWSSVTCTKRNGYICKKAASNAPVTPMPTAVTPSKPVDLNCPKEYIQYDQSCYKFWNLSKTFDEARAFCRKGKAELISVESEFEQALLIFLLERNLGNVWIGLSHEPWASLKFTDHSSPRYTYWGLGQPNRGLGQRTCVQANITGSNLGRWDDVDCNAKNPYVCEIYRGEPKITLAENSTCEEGWYKYQKHCYKYFLNYKSWPSARHICQNFGGDLLSIADDQEQDFTMFHFSNKPRTWVWIGLHDRSMSEGYEWGDHTPLTYVNWLKGQPNDQGQDQNCVLMDTRSGQWLDWRCSSPYSYICKKPLECRSKIPLNPDMITTTSKHIAFNLSVAQAILDADSPEDSAWCPNISTGISPKIKIELFKMVKISSITVKGRILDGPFFRKQHQFVKSFFIEYTADGWTWQMYRRDGIDVKFFANNNGVNAVTKTLDPPIVASSIRVLPTLIKGKQPCMKLSIQGCDFVCQSELGMKRWRILDNAIAASSAKYPTYAPKNARPNHAGWCAKTNNDKQWIQVDFGRTTLVSKITTYGDTRDSYVKRYRIQFSSDGVEWLDYKQHSGIRIFKGNLHAFHPMTHSLSNTIQATFIRIIPVSWNNNICMRFELFGCVKDCDGPLIQRNDNEVSEIQFSSSDAKSHPEYVRMDSGKAWCPKGKKQYLEIDFGRRVRIRHIATAGSPANYGEPRRVVTYALQRFVNNKWKPYKVDNSVMYIVSGNVNDTTTLSKYSFPGRKSDFIVQKLRIYPSEFTDAGICMRVELYGCLAEAEIVPTTPPTKQKVFDVRIHITSMEWDDNMKDKTSKEFKKAEKKIVKSVRDVYENNEDSQEGEALREVIVKELSKGSVLADLELIFNPRFSRNENVSKPLMEAVKNGKIGELKVDKIEIEEREDAAHSPGAESKGLSSGAVAGVVIGVLLVLLIAVGIGLYWRRKRKSALYGPKQFNNPILYSTANTDEFDIE